ncbi:hypothetical protein [Paramagnetospirillum kuznetsovii]|uniref:hypothetical protein n=1 Tax=Paramagnetospirillum kuznetsovii TaxID=2053833 RepID=UPI001EFD8D19|nr:hypothetical protein [Paramagnetospirillum kuznetsovii]
MIFTKALTWFFFRTVPTSRKANPECMAKTITAPKRMKSTSTPVFVVSICILCSGGCRSHGLAASVQIACHLADFEKALIKQCYIYEGRVPAKLKCLNRRQKSALCRLKKHQSQPARMEARCLA